MTQHPLSCYRMLPQKCSFNQLTTTPLTKLKIKIFFPLIFWPFIMLSFVMLNSITKVKGTTKTKFNFVQFEKTRLW